jgi:DNA polymerase-3 subunit gamma/tau
MPEPLPAQTNKLTNGKFVSDTDNTPSYRNSNPENWIEIIGALNLTGLSRELVNHCVLDGIDEQSCRLLLDANYQQVGSKTEEKLRDALQKYFGKPLKLIINRQKSPQITPAAEMQKAKLDRQQSAIENINSDPNILDLKDTFDARILPGSIEPHN